MNNRGWWIIGITAVVVVVLVAASHKTAAQSDSQGASISISLKVVPTIRSVTVSPSTATFGNCSAGSGVLASTSTALGYPHGRCWVGKPGVSGTFPIKVVNAGGKSRILVNGSGAAPSDGGTNWSLCNLPPDPVVACTSSGGKSPGADQYLVENFSSNGTQNVAGLTDHPVCDIQFAAAGGCAARPGQSQTEGVELTGPDSSQDFSTSWTVTITWTTAPP